MNILFLGKGSRAEVCRDALKGHTFVELVDDADLIIMANHNKILPKEIFSRPKYGAINCHAGKLPEYRGSSVLNWQIINGEIESGVSIIQIDEGIDTGGILFERAVPIGLKDTIGTLRDATNKQFAQMLPAVVHNIEIGAVSPIPQKEIRAPSYWHHREPEDSEIIWRQMTARQVYDLVRASEEPYLAFTDRMGTLLKDGSKIAPLINVSIARLLEDNYYGIPGRVVKRIDDGVVVIAADRGVWIEVELGIGEQLG